MILLLAAFVAAPPVVVIDGKPLEQCWVDFERHWFDFFDLDHNGKLNRAEAVSIPPIPDDFGKPIEVDFTSADQNVDSVVTPPELIAFYERRGVHASASMSLDVDQEAILLSSAIVRLLDRNGDWKLSP